MLATEQGILAAEECLTDVTHKVSTFVRVGKKCKIDFTLSWDEKSG